jgi:hypothetical protein
MEAKIQGGMLVVRVPLVKPPTLSKSGKTRLVATSHGAQRTSIEIEGKPVHIVLNGFIHIEPPRRLRFQDVLDPSTWGPAWTGKTRRRKPRNDE